MGRPSALRPDVRADRARRGRHEVRGVARRGEARARRRRGQRPGRGRPGRGHEHVPGDREGRHRARLPDRSHGAAGPRHSRGVRLVVRSPRPRLPRVQQDRPRPGDRRERGVHGLRQPGRGLGDGGCLHPRPEHRGAEALRGVPDQRPGRGRGGRHPDPVAHRPDAERHAPGVRRVRADRSAPGDPLPRRPGPGVHHRARTAVHAPDKVGQADRPGRHPDRGRDGGGGDHQPRGGPQARGAGPGGPAPPAALRRRRQGRRRRPPPGHRAERLPGCRHRQGGVRAGSRRGSGPCRRPGDPRPDRDQPRRRARHARREGRPDRAWWRHLARRGRGPLPGPPLRGRLRGAGHRLCRADHDRGRHDGSRGRHHLHRRDDRSGVHRRAGHHRPQLRRRAVPAHPPRVGRCRPSPPGVGQRGLPARRGTRPGLRGAGHRSMPDRAHVLRGIAPAHRPPHDPGRPGRDRCQAPARRRRGPQHG